MGNLLPTVRRFMVHEKWDDALFVHYRVDAEKLQQLLPEGLEVDLYGDEKSAWIGVVALTECGIIPTLLFPSWLLSFPLVRSLVAMTHHAVNVRTYVRPATTGPTTSSGDDEGQKQQQRERGEPGIYFFNLDCSTIPPAAGASIFFNLRYQYARMERSWRGSSSRWRIIATRTTVAIAKTTITAATFVIGTNTKQALYLMQKNHHLLFCAFLIAHVNEISSALSILVLRPLLTFGQSGHPSKIIIKIIKMIVLMIVPTRQR